MCMASTDGVFASGYTWKWIFCLCVYRKRNQSCFLFLSRSPLWLQRLNEFCFFTLEFMSLLFVRLYIFHLFPQQIYFRDHSFLHKRSNSFQLFDIFNRIAIDTINCIYTSRANSFHRILNNKWKNFIIKVCWRTSRRIKVLRVRTRISA